MESIDKIIFGDNQFFGINHMSQIKARQLSEKFADIRSVFDVYDVAFNSGIEAVMLNSNDRANEICDIFRNNPQKYRHIKWYPSIPYPYKYANSVSENGILQTLSDMLFLGSTGSDIINRIGKGSNALLAKDAIKIMEILIDIEMRLFKGLNIRAIFLQNVITDLMLGFEVRPLFESYCNYIRRKYKVIPGFITQNMPRLKRTLENWGINEVVICTSFNKLGYLMSPDVNTYVRAVLENNESKYQIMAMSTLASGAIPVTEAYSFINSQKIQSVVFGSSSGKNIAETISLIKI
jgi:hypothetical protein